MITFELFLRLLYQTLDLSVEELQRHVSFPHSDSVFDHLHSVAVQGATTLMNASENKKTASENKKTAFMDRIQDISIALVSGQNSIERHQQVSTTVLLTLSTIALELGVSSYLQAEDLVYVPKDNTLTMFDAASIAGLNTANEQDMSALFKPAPFNEQSTSQWTSGGSPSIG